MNQKLKVQYIIVIINIIHFFLFYLKNLDWIDYYSKPYVIASLNLNASKIDSETWASSVDNTNVAEAAHALANQEGKQLKLLTAIIRYFF